MKQICMAFLFGFSLVLFLLIIVEMFAYNWWGLYLLSDDVYDVLSTAFKRDCFPIIKTVVVLLLSISSVFTINYIGDITNKKDKNNNLPPTGLVY